MQESLLMSPTLEDEAPAGVRFLGEVPTSEFITGDALANAIGLTAGTTQHTNEPWLHFELDGKTLYVAKKPYRYNLSWYAINDTGAVRGDTAVNINGLTYRVRLLEALNKGNQDPSVGYGTPRTIDSEWNRLILPIHNGNHTYVNNTSSPGYYPLYSDKDLVLVPEGGNGSKSWCQERLPRASNRWCRGFRGTTYLTHSYRADNDTGWRPVLELVG